jgi:surface polysaccharide O-acyltransferase-like enzyme
MNQQRIHFLDFSRSVAILMMLQGHFISMTLESYPTFMAEVRLHGSSGSVWFSIWGFFRGLTAPLFFSISGAVFTYLLHKEWQKGNAPFFKLMRVKKGIRRALSLLLIGYLLQLNLKFFKYYIAGHFNPHFLGFHILQCIGVGLLLLLLMSALIYKIRPFSWLIYLGIALLIFGFTPLVRLQPEYFPAGAPPLLQNMIQGPDTGFSIFPWIGFVFLGAGFGHYLSLYGTGFKNKNVYKYLVVMGLVFYLIGWAMTFIYNGDFTHFHYKYLWAFDRAFFVAILLIFFTYLSGFERFRPKLFMAVGQETFAIYVIHAIILYGAVVGYSLRSFLENKLSALEAILGAILFLAFFIGLVQVLEPIRHFFRNFRTFFISNGKPSKP